MLLFLKLTNLEKKEFWNILTEDNISQYDIIKFPKYVL